MEAEEEEEGHPTHLANEMEIPLHQGWTCLFACLGFGFCPFVFLSILSLYGPPERMEDSMQFFLLLNHWYSYHWGYGRVEG